MKPILHRVNAKGRRPIAPLILPRDTWQGRTFVTADGTHLEVVASGKMPTPDYPWFLCGGPRDLPARLHLTAVGNARKGTS